MRLLTTISLLFLALAAWSQPRVALTRVEAAGSAGQFIIAKSDLDGEWSSFLLSEGDTVLHIAGGLIIDTVRQGTSDSVLIATGAGRVEWRSASGLGTDQTLSFSDPNLTISGSGGNTVDLSTLTLDGGNIDGFTSGSVIFAGSSGELTEDNTNLFWDDAANTLRIAEELTTTGDSLVLSQTGGEFGTTRLKVLNRTGAAGAIFENAGLDLVDFQFEMSGGDRLAIRTESRAAQVVSGDPEFQFGVFPASGGATRWLTFAENQADFPGTGGLQLHAGTDAERPTASAGIQRWNTTNTKMEYHDGSSWRNFASENWVTNNGTSIGSFTSGSVIFADGSGTLGEDNANLFWDDSNDALGIGVTSPLGELEIYSTSNFTGDLYLSGKRNTSTSTIGEIHFYNKGDGGYEAAKIDSENENGVSDGNLRFYVADAGSLSQAFELHDDTNAEFLGFVGIGTDGVPTYPLEVKNGIGGSSNTGAVRLGGSRGGSSNEVSVISFYNHSDGGYETAKIESWNENGVSDGNLEFYVADAGSLSQAFELHDNTDAEFLGTGGLQLHSGTDAERPTNSAGVIRWSTTNTALEYADGTNWRTLAASSAATFTSGSVIFADANGTLGEDNANFSFDDTNDRLLVATNSNTYNSGLIVASAPDATTFQYGIHSEMTATMSAYNANQNHGAVLGEVYTSNNIQQGTLVGVYGYAAPSSTGGADWVGAVIAGTDITAASGTYTQAYGLFSSNTISDATATDYSAGYFGVFETGTGTITNGYGVQIDDLTGNITNPYGVYQAGADDNNYFAGPVGLSVTAPDYTLDTDATDGYQFPAGTSAQQPSHSAGVMRWNTDNTEFEYSDGATWNSVATSTADGDGIYDGSGSLPGDVTVTAGTNLLDISGTAALGLPSGTDAQRPTGAAGRIRHSTTSGTLEWHDGSGWIDVIKSAATGLAIDANGEIDYDISSLPTGTAAAADVFVLYDDDGGSHFQEDWATVTFDGINISANGGTQTQISESENIDFEDGDGLDVSRTGNTITYSAAGFLLDLTDGSDFTFSAAENYVYNNISGTQTGSAASDITITLQTPAATLSNTSVRVYAEDDHGTHDVVVAAGANEIWEQGTTSSSITVANHETVELVVFEESGGTYVWVVVSRY